MEREFVDYGFNGLVIREPVEESMEITLNVMQLIQACLALCLAVGILGLGVLAVRNVMERRPIIGCLRALGFRRGMIHRPSSWNSPSWPSNVLATFLALSQSLQDAACGCPAAGPLTPGGRDTS